jgi:hypothetical protein
MTDRRFQRFSTGCRFWSIYLVVASPLVRSRLPFQPVLQLSRISVDTFLCPSMSLRRRISVAYCSTDCHERAARARREMSSPYVSDRGESLKTIFSDRGVALAFAIAPPRWSWLYRGTVCPSNCTGTYLSEALGRETDLSRLTRLPFALVRFCAHLCRFYLQEPVVVCLLLASLPRERLKQRRIGKD